MINTIPKTVKFRENLNITTRDQPINNTVIPYNTNPNTTIKNMRSEVELDIKEYTDVLKGKLNLIFLNQGMAGGYQHLDMQNPLMMLSI